MSCVYASTSNQYETYYSQVNSNDNISFNPYSHKFYVHRSDGTTERGTFNRTVDDLNNVYYDLRYDNMNAYQQVRVFDNGTILTPHGKYGLFTLIHDEKS
jgi:hypothetical protein